MCWGKRDGKGDLGVLAHINGSRQLATSGSVALGVWMSFSLCSSSPRHEEEHCNGAWTEDSTHKWCEHCKRLSKPSAWKAAFPQREENSGGTDQEQSSELTHCIQLLSSLLSMSVLLGPRPGHGGDCGVMDYRLLFRFAGS
jgi:hypothetical protein